MSFPVLRAGRDFRHVEVRVGRGAQRWRDMEEIHAGPARRGQTWSGGEGEKLSARHSHHTSGPNGRLSLPYTVSGIEGLGVGKPKTRTFPRL